MSDMNQGQAGADLSRQQFEAQVIERATRDEGFRQELLKDSRAVIEREYGVRVPDGVNIQVIEESPNDLYMVLPPRPTEEGSYELSDSELEAVAGGVGGQRTSSWTWCCIITLYG